MFMKDFTRSATDLNAATLIAAPVISGLLVGTRVETANGWLRVEHLRLGDRVQGLDGGLVRILALDRRILNPAAELPLLAVPGGAYGACSDLRLLPGQHLAMATAGQVGGSDDLFALIPALALEGRHGVTRCQPIQPVEVITPLFATEEVIWANTGLLLHCPSVATGAGRKPAGDFFPRLDVMAARGWLAKVA